MDDYHSIIARAVSRLPSKTDEARHAIYERARTALREKLSTLDPPISEDELAKAHAALDAAIGAVEVDFLFSEIRSSDIRGDAREQAAPTRSEDSEPRPSFISKLKKFVRSVVDKLKYKFK
jgi:hypothetical protein